MKKVYIEFMCRAVGHEMKRMDIYAKALDKDSFEFMNDEITSGPADNRGYANMHYIVRGKIFPEYATILKFQNPWLAERMKLSSISDELKDSFRQINI